MEETIIGTARRDKHVTFTIKEKNQIIEKYNSLPLSRRTHDWVADWTRLNLKKELKLSTFRDIIRRGTQECVHEDQARAKRPKWPKLEEMLMTWINQLEFCNITITGPAIIETANIFFSKAYPDQQEQPSFSNGWLTGFKKRNNIKQYTFSGEANSTKIDETAMVRLRTIAGSYNLDDIYNMDETGLFWRMTPKTGLATQPRRGIKKEKSRITVILCTNGSGTDKFPLWIIGKHKKPHCFRYFDPRSMGCEWKYNPKAWATSDLILEWFEAFCKHVGGRRVLLTLDNAPSHTKALKNLKIPDNIEIEFLPRNTTTHFQPLDQGIIQTFKLLYRKRFVRFLTNQIAERFTEGGASDIQPDPLKQYQLSDAIMNAALSWQTVELRTITNCFRKSTLVNREPTEHEIPVIDLSAEIEQYQQVSNEEVSIEKFLNPPEENFNISFEQTGTLEDARKVVIDHFEEMASYDESDEIEAPQKKLSPSEACSMIETAIKAFAECSPTYPGEGELIKEIIDDLKHAVQRSQSVIGSHSRQRTLDEMIGTSQCASQS